MTGSGVIKGRVLNTSTGVCLENTRVTLEGAGRETLTDAVGRYVFADVPAGYGPVTMSGLPLASTTATGPNARDGPGIPDVARFRQRDRYGALWIFVVKGTF